MHFTFADFTAVGPLRSDQACCRESIQETPLHRIFIRVYYDRVDSAAP
jgi:hypothetical protein